MTDDRTPTASAGPIAARPEAPSLMPPHPVQYEGLLRRALEEDLGLAGDLTTNAIVPADASAEGTIIARSSGRLAGLAMSAAVFELLDSRVLVARQSADGQDVEEGQAIAAVRGPARAILTGERVALNLLGRLSGIATATRGIVGEVEGFPTRVVCTRKTTPNLRALEKYAVRAGGGANHRFGLDDAVLIKDNHVAVAGGVEAAISRARRAVGHMVKIEVEVDTLAQLVEALAAGADAVLLDNMDTDTVREAVRLVGGRAITEASGGIRPATARAFAATGVDLLSVGWITHSAPALDVALEVS